MARWMFIYCKSCAWLTDCCIHKLLVFVTVQSLASCGSCCFSDCCQAIPSSLSQENHQSRPELQAMVDSTYTLSVCTMSLANSCVRLLSFPSPGSGPFPLSPLASVLSSHLSLFCSLVSDLPLLSHRFIRPLSPLSFWFGFERWCGFCALWLSQATHVSGASFQKKLNGDSFVIRDRALTPSQI